MRQESKYYTYSVSLLAVSSRLECATRLSILDNCMHRVKRRFREKTFIQHAWASTGNVPHWHPTIHCRHFKYILEMLPAMWYILRWRRAHFLKKRAYRRGHTICAVCNEARVKKCAYIYICMYMNALRGGVVGLGKYGEPAESAQ